MPEENERCRIWKSPTPPLKLLIGHWKGNYGNSRLRYAGIDDFQDQAVSLLLLQQLLAE
jgi:hypothetical protein